MARITDYAHPPTIEPTLFESTSRAAGRRAAKFAGQRYRQILLILADHPACIHEVAAALCQCQVSSVEFQDKNSKLETRNSKLIHPHQISGRFSELMKADLITRTGLRRNTPTGSPAEVYTITLTGLAVLGTPISRSAPEAPQ